MTHYINESITKGELSDSKAKEVLMMKSTNTGKAKRRELRHGAWIERARQRLKMRRFSSPSFALLLIFGVLFVGSVFLFENVEILTGPLYSLKIIMTSLFAVTLGFHTLRMVDHHGPLRRQESGRPKESTQSIENCS